jgi:hydroxymethylglutaryl-CoA lyase
MLEGMGVATGVDIDELVAAGLFISDLLGRPPGSRLGVMAARARADA